MHWSVASLGCLVTAALLAVGPVSAESVTLDLRYEHQPEAVSERWRQARPSPNGVRPFNGPAPTLSFGVLLPTICDGRGRESAFGMVSTGQSGCESGTYALSLTIRNR